METSPLHRLPAELASQLERKYFWWDALDAQPRSDDRILAQAMDLASFADVRRLETELGLRRLVEAMRAAEPGWISDRSWEFWRGRLRSVGLTIPQTPPRRRFDAGLF
jgi:hypothetical protein